MYTSAPFARALLTFARQTLEDASASASTLSETQLRTLDAIFFVLGEQLKRNDETLLSSLMLTDLFDTQFETSKINAQDHDQLIVKVNASIDLAFRVIESTNG
jgi:hypothetical protein